MDYAGLRVLVVEDEFLVALGLEDGLKALGCAVVGPVASLAAAVDAAENEALDAALLDVNLNGESVYPAARLLDERNIPFVFCSAFTTRERMPGEFSQKPRVAKPYTGQMIATALADAVWPEAGRATLRRRGAEQTTEPTAEPTLGGEA